MVRPWTLAAFVFVAGCADGDVNDEGGAKSDGSTTPTDAPPGVDAKAPIVKCQSGTLPRTGDRCDSSEVTADAYCRLGSCNKQCEDECSCASGVWQCRVFCR